MRAEILARERCRALLSEWLPQTADLLAMKHHPSSGVDDFGQTRYRRISPMTALFKYFLKVSF
jgi:hypothetical protein